LKTAGNDNARPLRGARSDHRSVTGRDFPSLPRLRMALLRHYQAAPLPTKALLYLAWCAACLAGYKLAMAAVL